MVITLDKVKLIVIRVIENSKTKKDLVENLFGQGVWVQTNDSIIKEKKL